jgi:hypothetical protein
MSVDPEFAPWPGLGSLVDQSVMPIVAYHEGRYHHCGTAFVIFPNGLLMTAKHIIDFAETKYSTRVWSSDGSFRDEFEVFALYVSDLPNETDPENLFGGFIAVSSIVRAPAIDIALLSLRPQIHKETGEQLTFPSWSLRPEMPPIGQRVLGCGYPGNYFHRDENETAMVLDYERNTAVTPGFVREVHLEQRDSLVLPFPVFETDARFDNGMSGGPICCENGYVCGVITSGYDPSDDYPGWTGYGSAIFPALGLPINGLFADIPADGEPTYLWDAVTRGIVRADDSFGKFRRPSS